MNFVKWSDLNSKSRLKLKPKFDITNWDDLMLEKRELILRFFQRANWFNRDLTTYISVVTFNENHKAQNYCHHIMGNNNIESACMDVSRIFSRETGDVVYELISYYATTVRNESNIKYQKFKEYFNDISNQFGLDIVLVDGGLMMKQEVKIQDAIYEPVLNFLSDTKFKAVNRDLTDAFNDYIKNTPEAYSSCITHAIAALEAFLQIISGEKIGSKKLNILLKEGITNKLIPDDYFSQKIFKDIDSILMQERQAKGDSHPKTEYANAKTAKLVLNLVMVFMQHIIQK